MIKENRQFFLYVLGILAMFVAILVIFQYVVLGRNNSVNCGFLGINCIFKKSTTKVYSSLPEMNIDTNKDYKALVKTSMGDFTIDLYEKNAPMAVNNFVFLAQDSYYNNVSFHRVVKGVLIQTGDRNTLDNNPNNDGSGGPGYSFADEINWESLGLSEAKRQQLTNLGYSNDTNVTSQPLEQMSVAMANNGPDTNGSQFFIVTAPSDDVIVKGMEGRYTVFGKVISGWDTVQKIESVQVDDPTASSPKPLEKVVVNEIVITTD